VLLAGAMTYPSIPKGSEVIGTSQGTKHKNSSKKLS